MHSFKQAVAAGAKVAMPVEDMFWGDRCMANLKIHSATTGR